MIGEFSLKFRSIVRSVLQTSVHTTCTTGFHFRDMWEIPEVDDCHHTNPVMYFVLRELIIAKNNHLRNFNIKIFCAHIPVNIHCARNISGETLIKA